MIHKLINRLNKSFKCLKGYKPLQIKIVNFCYELTKSTKIKKLSNKVIKQTIYNSVDKNYIISQAKEDWKEQKKDSEFPKKIWTMWWQGEEQAPDLVKATLQSIKMFANQNSCELIILDEHNIKDYLIIPEGIITKMEDGKLGIANFSDLIRCMLIDEYGGIWLDSTIFITEKFPISILEREFSSINHPDNLTTSLDNNITNKRWVSFVLSGKKGNIVTKYLKYFMLHQIESTKELPDYFMIDFGLDYLYDEFEEIKSIIDEIPRYSSQKDIFWLSINKNQLFDNEKWSNELEKNQLFKCSYKYDKLIEKSYFDYLIKQKL